jgi:lysine 2,3-aminomutase
MNKRTLTSPRALVGAGLISPDSAQALAPVAERFAVAVTPAMAALIDPIDPADPIARQFVPDRAELDVRPEELADPIGDAAHRPVAGIVHRYPDRALLTLTHACPVYCRFCFRREVVGPGGHKRLEGEALESALSYLAATPAVWEVILTGGDPLAVAPARLAAIMRRLGAMAHVRVIRVHSRVPAVAPQRIDAALIAALGASGKPVYVALHANHPRELTAAARAACARLVDAGLPMLSQSVLLAGVNDDVETLAALMRAFVETRIKPYYLHHLDLARGASHLRVPLEKGQALMRALQGRVSGLCLPAYMLDIPGGHGKIPVGPQWLDAMDNGVWRARDPFGGEHVYPPPADRGGRTA